LIEDIVVRDPEHAKPLVFEPGLSNGVMLESAVVAAAIEFDHDSTSEVNEIDDETADGSLTPKLLAADATSAQRPP